MSAQSGDGRAARRLAMRISTMFIDGNKFFLCLPSESGQRTLHPATITEVDGETVTATLYEPNLAVQPGAEAFVFFEQQRTFMQQAIRIDAVFPPNGGNLSDDVSGQSDESVAGSARSGQASRARSSASGRSALCSRRRMPSRRRRRDPS